MNRQAFHLRNQAQTGFTLIEVLVAGVILTIGLLGLAGLQATSQKLTHSAYQRSQAASLAYELADAIRANASHASEYIGAYGPTSCNPNPVHGSADVVANDLAEWTNNIACLFVSGQGVVGQTDNIVTIGITWNEDRARGTDDSPIEGSGEDLRDQFSIEVAL